MPGHPEWFFLTLGRKNCIEGGGMEANYNNPARHATNPTSTPFGTLRQAQGSAQQSRLRGRVQHDLRLFRDGFELKNVRRSARVVFSVYIPNVVFSSLILDLLTLILLPSLSTTR